MSEVIYNEFENIFGNGRSNDIVKSIISEIPSQYFEPKIVIDDGINKISIVQFVNYTAGMPKERVNGLMDKYKIDPYDVKNVQNIIESVKVACQYENVKTYSVINNSKKTSQDKPFGFSLSPIDKLSKAYPLWVAYLCANSANPLNDIKIKLKEDGVEKRYNPETILALIEHTNVLLNGKSELEKKEFYISSINGILDDNVEHAYKKETLEI